MVKGATAKKNGSKNKKGLTLHKRVSPKKLTRQQRFAKQFGFKTLKSKKKIPAVDKIRVELKMINLINDVIGLIKRNVKVQENMGANDDTLEYLEQFIPRLDKLKENIFFDRVKIDTPNDIKHALADVFEILKHLFYITPAASAVASKSSSRSMSEVSMGSRSSRSMKKNDELDDLIGRMGAVAVNNSLNELSGLIGRMTV